MHALTHTHAELLATGLGQRDIDVALGNGELRKLRHGVYTFQMDEALDDHLQLIDATRKVVGADNVISHTSAGLLHGLPVERASRERVTMTRLTEGHGTTTAKLRMRRTEISDEEYELLDGRLVTTLARTAADLCRTEPHRWGIAAVDAALAKGLDPSSVAEVLALHPRLHGRRKATRLLELADGDAESPLESMSRFNMVLTGLPTPELQVEHFDADGVFVARTDFFWREFGVVGEADGVGKYFQSLRPGESPEQAVSRQLQRDQALRSLGLWPVHWGWAVGTNAQALHSLLAPVLR